MARSWIAEVNIDFAIAALKSRSKRLRKKASFHAVKLKGVFDASEKQNNFDMTFTPKHC